MSLAIKPIIFLAFANDKSGKEAYLKALKKERIEIQAMLQPAVDAGLCEVVIEPDATAEDVFRVFNQYPNRIAVFHYAGHGSPDGLSLTSENSILNKMASSFGLSQLFGTQQNLKLVFLNACATNGQIENIREQTTSNVITTLSSINDNVALNFAVQFYQAIGRKETLEDAYDIAEAFIKTVQNVGTPEAEEAESLWLRGLKRSKRPKQFPWRIEGETLGWSLVQGGAIFGNRPEIEVFVAYAPEDEMYMKKLQKHLALLKRFRMIKTFSIADIKAQQEMDKELKTNLLNARLILLLISSNFLIDEKCYEIEQIAMERRNRNTAAVVPIYIQPIDMDIMMDDFELPEFAKLRGLPNVHKKRFVTQWPNKDEAYVHIVKGLKHVIQDLRGK
ncbi:MAG: TIR domain-containing protein [Chitinophagales bacterium]